MSEKKNLAGQIKLAELQTFTVINSDKAIPKKVTLIFDEDESSIVNNFIEEYDEKKVIFTKYSDCIKEFKEDILESFDYIVFFVSEKSMKNNGIIRLLLKNYKKNNFIAIISDSIFLELKGRVKIYEYWKEQLNYTEKIMQSGMINEDVFKENRIYNEVVQMLGVFFEKTYENNLLRDEIEDVFENRLSQDGINDLRKKYSSTNKDEAKQQKGKYVLMESEALNNMNQNNYYAQNMTINNGGDKSRFKSSVLYRCHLAYQTLLIESLI